MTWRISRLPKRPSVVTLGLGHRSVPFRVPGCAQTDAGFSLIEVLVVLAILGLSASMVLGRGPPRSPSLEARAAATQVSQALRLARAQAISGGERVVFVLDVAGGYRVGTGPVKALPRGLTLTMTAVAALTAGDNIGGIDFLPDGSSSGGRVGVAGGATRAWVGVDWLTGRVSVTDAP